MTVTERSPAQEVYFSAFAAAEKELAAASPSWVHSLRREALERFGELGFPTIHDEEWKYTSVAAITRAAFRHAPDRGAGGVAAGTPQLAGLRLADFDGHRLVFVNGRYQPELSSVGLQRGVRVLSLAAALAADSERTLRAGDGAVESHLARYASWRDQAFVALNTAFLSEGAFVEIADGVTVEKPIYLVFVTAGAAGNPERSLRVVGARGSEPGIVSHPRILVLAGRDSQASVVEAYLAPRENGRGRPGAYAPGWQGYFTNAVTEIVARDNAVIEYYKLQEEAPEAFHIATMHLYQERASNVTSHSVSLGGLLVRNDVNVVLDAEGAEATLNGLYVAMGEQHVDNHTRIDHAKPHCNSRELYKGILGGKAAGVFNGAIVVRKDAQKTDAKQSNKNLLLSEDAVINTKPQLQIHADDVRCTHGATIGQMDDDAVFYLRARGIDEQSARNLLTYAFTNDLLTRMKVEAVRKRLEAALFERLSEAR